MVKDEQYGETFAPVCSLTTALTLMTYGVRNKCNLHLLDFQGAFLHSSMPEQYEVYIQTPMGLKIGSHQVVRLAKSLYGTKNAGNLWFEDQGTKKLDSYC
jgi:hypothetical protein